MTKHTPGPWHLGPHYKSDVESAQGRVCECSPMMTPRGVANARLIVMAVNCHADLLAVLADLVTRCNGEEGVRADGSNIDTQRAHVALAKASEDWR